MGVYNGEPKASTCEMKHFIDLYQKLMNTNCMKYEI